MGPSAYLFFGLCIDYVNGLSLVLRYFLWLSAWRADFWSCISNTENPCHYHNDTIIILSLTDVCGCCICNFNLTFSLNLIVSFLSTVYVYVTCNLLKHCIEEKKLYFDMIMMNKNKANIYHEDHLNVPLLAHFYSFKLSWLTGTNFSGLFIENQTADTGCSHEILLFFRGQKTF